MMELNHKWSIKKSHKVKLIIFTVLFWLSVTSVFAAPKFLGLPIKEEAVVGNGWYYSYQSDASRSEHCAIDYYVENDTDVIAAADGWAMKDYQEEKGYGYGNFIIIKHDKINDDDKHYFTLYAHLNEIIDNIPPKSRFTAKNNLDAEANGWYKVNRGELIGKTGQTGGQSFPHLHFGVFVDEYKVRCGGNDVDPYDIDPNFMTNVEDSANYYPPNMSKTINEITRTSGSKYSSCGADRLWISDPPKPADYYNGLIIEDANGDLYKLNASDGSATLFGSTGINNLTDIAFDGSDFYGVTFTEFISIDNETKKGTIIDQVGFNNINALAVSKDGVFYAGTADGEILKIDPKTGKGTLMGYLPNGLFIFGDIAFNSNGKLYAIVKRFVFGNSMLATIDLSSRQTDVIGDTGYNNIFGLSFIDEELFGVTENGEVLLINIENASIIKIGNNGIKQWGMTLFNLNSAVEEEPAATEEDPANEEESTATEEEPPPAEEEPATSPNNDNGGGGCFAGSLTH